jgi:hypothetical protein
MFLGIMVRRGAGGGEGGLNLFKSCSSTASSAERHFIRNLVGVTRPCQLATGRRLLAVTACAPTGPTQLLGDDTNNKFCEELILCLPFIQETHRKGIHYTDRLIDIVKDGKVIA